MRWLFLNRIRPFVLLAAAASFVLNLALLVPALYMMQVFDRVFASRSVETLVMLSAFVSLALALGYFVDTVRTRALAWAGRLLDRELSPAALASALRNTATASNAPSTESLRDITLFHELLNKQGKTYTLTFGPLIPPEHVAGDSTSAIRKLKHYVERVLPNAPDTPFDPNGPECAFRDPPLPTPKP